MEKNISIIVEARLNSKRFPNKVIQLVNGLMLIEHQIMRLKHSMVANNIILATPKEKSDIFRKIAAKHNIYHYEGSEKNVLQRVYFAAKKFDVDIIVRSTGDCPLIDPNVVDLVISTYLKNNKDFVANTIPPTYPDGMDVSVFSKKLLGEAYKTAKTDLEKENITRRLRVNPKITKLNVKYKKKILKIRLTLDTEQDYILIKKIINFFLLRKKFFSLEDILKFRDKNLNIFDLNKNIPRNQGSSLPLGQKIWLDAKNFIPGGNMFLSKKPERILPNQWPVYFNKSKGCFVWDLENKKYLDFGLMGVGTSILGYSNKLIDNAVIETIKKGNVSSLNCKEDLDLAKKLLKLNSWAGMVKLARTGGEANAIAVRISRISSKSDNIAICGYHGWHDWYLAANLKNKKNLDTHLLKGLNASGVPKKLNSTIFPFEYGKFNQLKKLIDEKNIGIIKMEVARSYESPSFLKKIRQLCDKKKIVLIFDECTSGFRETNTGLHEKFKIYPDIAIYGKALGNGYAISAVVGKKDLMKKSSVSFISSTFWSERIGPTAALKTLEIMEKEKSWITISKKGLSIKSKIKSLIEKNKLNIQVMGLQSVIKIKFNYQNPEIFKTYLAQEFLKKKILSGDLIYVSIAHSTKDINRYIKSLDNILMKISACLKSNDSIIKLLEVPVAEVEFERLN